jgi:cobalamin biosynthesis protein CobD/CbiB
LRDTNEFEYAGILLAVACVALFELPLLSFHPVTFAPVLITVTESAASNHKANPESDRGLYIYGIIVIGTDRGKFGIKALL